MPTYGYECSNCGSGFEIIQKMSDDPLTVCETCGGPLRKKVFPVGIVFKGAGFYVNDYASKKNGEEAASKPEAKASAGAAADTTSPAGAADTNPAEKAAEPKPAAAPTPAAAPAAPAAGA